MCRKVRDSERYNWAATQGVNEERLMENFPEDLQRDIRRHLFKFVKEVRLIFIGHQFLLVDNKNITKLSHSLHTLSS